MGQGSLFGADTHKRHRFPPTIIRHAVWIYARFTLSYRDFDEMLAEKPTMH